MGSSQAAMSAGGNEEETYLSEFERSKGNTTHTTRADVFWDNEKTIIIHFTRAPKHKDFVEEMN